MKETETASALEWLVLEASAAFDEISRLEHISDFEVQKQAGILKINVRNSCTECFKKCIEDGLFISSVDIETIVSIYIEEMKNLKPKFRLAMMQPFLSGLCTEKGMDELKRIHTY